MRVARDGRNYRRGWERRVDGRRRPADPAAVRVYDAAGDAPVVSFDLDAKRNRTRQTVLRDCNRLTGWLSAAGCRFFIEESPNGGRHVYVPLAVPAHTANSAPSKAASARPAPLIQPAGIST